MSQHTQSESPLPWEETPQPETPALEQTPALDLTPAQEMTPALEETLTHQKTKRLHYTPELKLQLMRLCVNNGEQYIQEPSNSEIAFWQHISALFQEMSGHQKPMASHVSVRRNVQAMVDERKAVLEERKGLSGVAIPPVTDLEQAIDSWIEISERRAEVRDTMKSQASADVKKEKAVAEVLRDNLGKRLSPKHDFQAVVEAREVVNLEAPRDVIHKRRQIRENLTRLPMSSGYDALLVVVDRLSKMAHYIPTTTDVTSKGIARLYFDHIFRLHGKIDLRVSLERKVCL